MLQFVLVRRQQIELGDVGIDEKFEVQRFGTQSS